MKSVLTTRTGQLGAAGLTLLLAATIAAAPQAGKQQSPPPSQSERGMIDCANLIYGKNKTSVCFSSEFLKQIGKQTNVVASPKLRTVKLESAELYQYPFAVMTGEGAWRLTQQQRTNLRNYLESGGFIVASAGCSSPAWITSFRSQISATFPENKLKRLDLSHPIFHTVYDIKELKCKKKGVRATLEGLEIDGKIVLIFSPDGLNDTSKAGGKCCCCGGNEIRNSRQINVNLLAYTLTH